MSFWSDLYAGDAERIARALEDGEQPDASVVVEHVNLPSVLPFGDISMDVLTYVVTGGSFQDAIANEVVGEEEHRTFVLDARWAQAMAGLADAMDVARRFLAEGDPGAEDDASQVETFTGLVEGVVRVCRAAHSRGLGLVYAWTL